MLIFLSPAPAETAARAAELSVIFVTECQQYLRLKYCLLLSFLGKAKGLDVIRLRILEKTNVCWWGSAMPRIFFWTGDDDSRIRRICYTGFAVKFALPASPQMAQRCGVCQVKHMTSLIIFWPIYRVSHKKIKPCLLWPSKQGVIFCGTPCRTKKKLDFRSKREHWINFPWNIFCKTWFW